jgi:uncharacterized protein (UPF0333 family)
MFFKSKKGQSTMEYALLIAAVVGAFVLMQRYVQYAAQGKLKESADDMAHQFTPEDGWVNGFHTKDNGMSTTTEEAKMADSDLTTKVTSNEEVTRDEASAWGDRL